MEAGGRGAAWFRAGGGAAGRINAIWRPGKKQTVIAGLCARHGIIWGLYQGQRARAATPFCTWRTGSLTGRETELFTAPMEETEEEMLSALTAQYYLPRAILPHEILLPLDTGECEELSEVLTKRAGRKVWVHVPQRGEKAELRTMAQRNAREEAGAATTAEERVAHTLALLGKMLDLPAPPGRMESFDISNTGKSDSWLHGGIQRDPAFEKRLPQVPDQRPCGASGRLCLHAGGSAPPAPAGCRRG